MAAWAPANLLTSDSLNAVLISLLGIVFLLGGIAAVAYYALYVLGFGLLSTALGCVCCGLTDGFTERSHRGFIFKRIGGGALIVGVPILFYSAYRMI